MMRFLGWDFTISIPIKSETCNTRLLGDMLIVMEQLNQCLQAQLSSDVKQNIEEYLAVIVPGMHRVHVKSVDRRKDCSSYNMLQEINIH